MLKFSVKNQTLQRTDSFEPASDSADYLKASFVFNTDDWNETKRVAVFINNGVPYPALINSQGICNVPNSALASGSRQSITNLKISVYGEKDDGYRITTDVINVRLKRGFYEPLPVTISNDGLNMEPDDAENEEVTA